MSYFTQADMADDGDLQRRVIACAALEGDPRPDAFMQEHKWVLSAQPGWDEAYAYAIAQGNPRPGRDEAVISDSMILTAVQLIRSGT